MPEVQPERKYKLAHVRLGRRRGPAREHACVDCGEPAAQWSLEGDPTDHMESESGLWFSLDPMDYVPRCLSCHTRLDRATRHYRETGEVRPPEDFKARKRVICFRPDPQTMMVLEFARSRSDDGTWLGAIQWLTSLAAVREIVEE